MCFTLNDLSASLVAESRVLSNIGLWESIFYMLLVFIAPSFL